MRLILVISLIVLGIFLCGVPLIWLLFCRERRGQDERLRFLLERDHEENNEIAQNLEALENRVNQLERNREENLVARPRNLNMTLVQLQTDLTNAEERIQINKRSIGDLKEDHRDLDELLVLQAFEVSDNGRDITVVRGIVANILERLEVVAELERDLRQRQEL